MSLLKFSQTEIFPITNLTTNSLKIIKKKIQSTKSNNFIGHNIFLFTFADKPI
jgi:hypothetical protein